MKKITASVLALFLAAILSGCFNTPSEGASEATGSDKSSFEGSEAPGIEVVVVEEGKLAEIKSGEYTVKSGYTVLVNGKLRCEKDAEIVVEDGGELLVNGELEVSGELLLEGYLAVSDSASVCGTGTVLVNEFDDINCEGRFTAKITPPEPVVTNGVTTVGGVIIVNKAITISPDYGNGLTAETEAALERMRRASGYEMPVISGFRDYETQVAVFENWCTKNGIEEAERFSSRPGHSEHQTGLTVDVTSTADDFAYTDEARWIGDNCYKYGFIVRYPKGKEEITGYIHEPWHLRYLGESTAKLVHDSGLTLEEFLGVEGGDYRDEYVFSRSNT